MKRLLIVMILCGVVVSQAYAQGLSGSTMAYLPLVVREVQPTVTPVSPTATATPTLPPPSFTTCATQPNPATAPNYPVRIAAIDKQAETVTLQNVSTQSIDLSGWRMCSITGNQTHPISGSLAAGESRTFVNPSGLIWNNQDPDPGALYTPDGRLASYRDA
jgi:hypothetical protein